MEATARQSKEMLKGLDITSIMGDIPEIATRLYSAELSINKNKIVKQGDANMTSFFSKFHVGKKAAETGYRLKKQIIVTKADEEREVKSPSNLFVKFTLKMDERYSDNLFEGGFVDWWDSNVTKLADAVGGPPGHFIKMTTVSWSAGENTYTFKFSHLLTDFNEILT